MSDAARVWSRIQAYRVNTAKELERAYVKQSAIIARLEDYSRKGEYHGHASGAAGEPENPGITETLNAAISFLRLHKPAPVAAASSSKPKGMNPQHRANLDQTARLQQLIDNTNDLGLLQSLLAAAQPLWFENKTVWGDYERKYETKKGKKPLKPKA